MIKTMHNSNCFCKTIQYYKNTNCGMQHEYQTMHNLHKFEIKMKKLIA
jgi:hypothetical protein